MPSVDGEPAAARMSKPLMVTPSHLYTCRFQKPELSRRRPKTPTFFDFSMKIRRGRGTSRFFVDLSAARAARKAA